jgi:hypothetical protein
MMPDNPTNPAVDTKPGADRRLLRIGAMCGTAVLAVGMLLLLMLGSAGLVPPAALERYGEVLIYLCPGIYVLFGALYAVRRVRKA